MMANGDNADAEFVSDLCDWSHNVPQHGGTLCDHDNNDASNRRISDLTADAFISTDRGNNSSRRVYPILSR
jgi:hypothetical protein